MSNSNHSSSGGSGDGGHRDRNSNSNGSSSNHNTHNHHHHNNNSNANGRMHQRSPQHISNTFSGGGGHHSHQGSRRYAYTSHSSRLSHNSNGSYRQQRNHYPYGSSHYNNNSNNHHKPHPRFDRERLDNYSNWSTTVDEENNHSGGNGNSRYFSNYKSYSSGNKYRNSNYNKRRSNDDQYYNGEYNDEEEYDVEEYEQDGYEDDYQDLDYGRTYGSQFTIDEIAELERAMETRGEEYLDVDGRPPPFEYDTNNPPIPLKKEQLNPGDILCVYHPEFCFWYVNYGFHEFSDKTQELVLKSLDPRVEECKRELRIPCESAWPLIYRYTRADKEVQLKNELEQVASTTEKQVSRKLEIQKKKLLEIQWDDKDDQIMKSLHLYWIHHKNSFLRCLNLAAKVLKIPDTTYEDLTVISGAGIYFRWKEAFDDEYSKMGSVDEEIQLINATSSLQLEQVWTDTWRSQTTNKDDSAKAEYIKRLEEKVVESLKKKALVLTHDNNGHFGILCAYKALKKDLIDEMKFLEKPANYVFLLKKFVLDEDTAEGQNEDHISIVSRRHVVFVKAKEINPQSDLKFEVAEKIRLKEALQTAIQVYYCNEKEISDKNLNETDGNVTENKEKNENGDVANSIDQTTNQTEEPKKEDTEKASTTVEEENSETKEIAEPKIEDDTEDKIEELEAKTFNPEVEGSLGFKRWIECLAPDRVLKNELYMLSLHCLMLFYDARCSLISYLDKLVSYDKSLTGEPTSTQASNNTNKEKKNLTNVLNSTKDLLKKQSKLIRLHELIRSHEPTGSQSRTIFDEFDGSFSIFSLPDEITLEKRNEYKEELRTLVEEIANFEPDIVKCYEDIVELLP